MSRTIKHEGYCPRGARCGMCHSYKQRGIGPVKAMRPSDRRNIIKEKQEA